MEIDFQAEYYKLELMCEEKNRLDYFGERISINTWININFGDWDKPSNYAYYSELREQLGFPAINKEGICKKCL